MRVRWLDNQHKKAGVTMDNKVKKQKREVKKKTGQGKRKPARSISEEDIARVEVMAGYGMKREQIARVFGISTKTFYGSKASNAKFNEAYERGVARAHEAVALKLFQAIQEGSPWAIKLYLKTRCGFNDQVKVDHTSSDGSMSPMPDYAKIEVETQKAIAELKHLRAEAGISDPLD